MKKHILCLLAAAFIFPMAAFAEEGEMAIEQAEQQLELRNIQLEQKRAEMDFEFNREMRQIEIEKARLEIEHGHQKLRQNGRHRPHGPLCIILLIAVLNRILAPIWIYRDMRQRNANSVILVLLGILGGLAGLLAYAVVRIGDVGAAAPRAKG